MTAMTESAELKPCPCCGGGASFDHDDDGWNWIVCGSCGLSTDRAISLMDDCRPGLREKWNRRSPVDAAEGWRTLVKDLVEELEEQVCHRYQGYPQDDRRFVRDMLTMKEARAMLAGEPASTNTTTSQAEGGEA